MTEIPVNTSRNYTVHIGNGLLKECGNIVKELLSPCKILIVTDTNVGPIYLETVINSLKSNSFECVSYTFQAGEKYKNIDTLSNIWEYAAKQELTRKDCMLALGGGVVGDVTGFAASTYLRGIPCIQVPTSLLAAVDSSVGGKTAIDLTAGKNLAGAFSQPLVVICDTNTIKTLPEHFITDGIAECIKYGVLGNKKLLDIFKKEIKSYETLSPYIETVISESVKMKRDYVLQDEFDKGARQFLNLGHTLGHSIEQRSNFEISHGYAVAIGMVLIAEIGEALGITEAGTLESLVDIVSNTGLPTKCSYTGEELVSAISKDKKRSGNAITLVMPTTISTCILKEFKVDDFESIVAEMIK